MDHNERCACVLCHSEGTGAWSRPATTWADVRKGDWIKFTREGGRGGSWSDVARVVRAEPVKGGRIMATVELLPSPGSRHGRGAGRNLSGTYRADAPVTVVS